MSGSVPRPVQSYDLLRIPIVPSRVYSFSNPVKMTVETSSSTIAPTQGMGSNKRPSPSPTLFSNPSPSPFPSSFPVPSYTPPEDFNMNMSDRTNSSTNSSTNSRERSNNFSDRSASSTPRYNKIQEEVIFSPPARPVTFQQDQAPFSLPFNFNSSSKKQGFMTGGDVASSTTAIREAFQGPNDNFSPDYFDGSTGRLPIRRKVRFSEG